MPESDSKLCRVGGKETCEQQWVRGATRHNFPGGIAPVLQHIYDTLGASSEFDQQSMIALASSRILELGTTLMEEWPFISGQYF
jgi:hypothetical protein